MRYLVLNCFATYNVLIGRQRINDIHAVVSTPNLKMKYPTKNGKICVLAVDQKVAKECLAKNKRNMLNGENRLSLRVIEFLKCPPMSVMHPRIQ